MLRTLDQVRIVVELVMDQTYLIPTEYARPLIDAGVATLESSHPRTEAAALAAPSRRG